MKTLRTLLITCAFLLCTTHVEAAPKKFFWGQAGRAGESGISFHRQASNISNFHAVVPVHCTTSDNSEYESSFTISGTEVPNLLISSRHIDSEFDYTDYSSLSPEALVTITADFRNSERATFNVLVTTYPDPELFCYGGTTFSRVRKGARIRD